MTYIQSRVWAENEQAAVDAIFALHGPWLRLSVRPWESQPRPGLTWYEYYLLSAKEAS